MEQFRICKDCDFSGVYAIVNTDNKKIYVGTAKNIRKRLSIHRSRLKSNTNSVKKMQEDYNNGDSFVSFVVTPVSLSPVKGKEDNNLKYFEDNAMRILTPYYLGNGYNAKGGCSQLVEVLNIMDAEKIIEKSDFDALLNKEWRYWNGIHRQTGGF